MLYLKCNPQFCVTLISLFLLVSANVLPWYTANKNIKTKENSSVLPWIGVLKYKPHKSANETVVGIIWISYRLAIGDAKEVAKINIKTIRETTRAMFLSRQNQVMYCAVVNYTLHPEYDEETLTTLAIITLEYDDDDFKDMDTLDWPINGTSFSDVFSIGYTNLNGKLKQVLYRMEQVDITHCHNFYVQEESDAHLMRPVLNTCYRGRFNQTPCVYNPGMALAANVSGTWTLLGMSLGAWGPGCTLPARFISFPKYATWIKSKIQTRRQDRSQGGLFSEAYHENENDYMYSVEKVSQHVIVLRSMLQETHEHGGKCGSDSETNNNLIYHEKANYKVPDYAMGIYTFSHYNLNFYWNWKCIIVTCTAKITYKSDTERQSEGYRQKFTNKRKFKDFVKIYPVNKPLDTEEESLASNQSDYAYIDIRHLYFRFDFYKHAKIKIRFYGPKIGPFTTTETPDTDTQSTTSEFDETISESYSTTQNTETTTTLKRKTTTTRKRKTSTTRNTKAPTTRNTGTFKPGPFQPFEMTHDNLLDVLNSLL